MAGSSDWLSRSTSPPKLRAYSAFASASRVALAEVRARAQALLELGAERRVRALRHDALLVQQRDHARRARLVDEVDHHLVVKVGDRLPRHALALVLLLLRLERELDEDLLQLLVAVVDAELLERVRLEDLEAVDVQHADGQ